MIDKVGKSCTGCGSCEARCPYNAISHTQSSDGFYYPFIDPTACTGCNLCERVCPALVETSTLLQVPLASYAANTLHKPLLSSSGGSFHAIAKKFISGGGFVCGATISEDVHVKHVLINKLDDLKKLCGSKYVQSHINSTCYKLIENSLRSGNKVLFVGTPCQVAGIKLYLRKEYDNLFTIDLICHGVPSPGIFADYIAYCSKLRHKSIYSFVCRDNRDGWNKYFKSTIKYSDGTEEYNSALSNLWNRIFFSELITRTSCHECRFTQTNRVGDITLGDFWGLKECDQFTEKTGASLLLCNTRKGADLLKTSQLNIIEAYTDQKNHPNLYNPTLPNPLRSQFMTDYSTEGFNGICKKYFGFSAWLDLKIRIYSWLKR